MNQISFEDLFEEEKEKVEVAEVCKVPALYHHYKKIF